MKRIPAGLFQILDHLVFTADFAIAPQNWQCEFSQYKAFPIVSLHFKNNTIEEVHPKYPISRKYRCARESFGYLLVDKIGNEKASSNFGHPILGTSAIKAPWQWKIK
jgi:hypothetical protein